jgi:hypothetical protein
MVQTGPPGIEAAVGVNEVLSKAEEEAAAHGHYRKASVGVLAGHRFLPSEQQMRGSTVPAALTPMPPALHVARLLRHIAEALTGAVPAPYALAATADELVLLEHQRIAATTRIGSPDETDDPYLLLVGKGREILDEAQDLVMTTLGRVWPPGAPAHAAAEWDNEAGTVRLGFYPSGDLARRPPVLAVPPYRPPTGPPRIAG